LDVSWQVGAKRYIFTGSLVGNYIREEESKLYRVSLSPEIKNLFSPASYTQLEWEERLTLKSSPLAQWLHSYFSTHAKPFAVGVAYLKEKTGSPTRLLKHFKAELKTALKALESLEGWTVEWEGDNVTVRHPETGSQARHIARKDGQRKALKAAKQQDLAPKPTRTKPQQRPQHPSGVTSMRSVVGDLFN
jgi:hypothetical protein